MIRRSRPFRFRIARTALLVAAGLASTAWGQPPAPGERWLQLASPAAAGWDESALAAIRADAEAAGTAALLVVEDGRVVVAWGDVARPFKTASLRKSLVVTMAGWYVESGTLRLDATLAELGVDDVGGLSAQERGAKVSDLMAARSGVYHPAAKEPPGMIENRPARGSHAPGSFWFYNNWDFNLVGTLVERAAGQGVFELFAERIAAPLGMEEFDPARSYYEREPRNSRFPAWEFRISTRDLARFGQMILDGGRYAGREVVPAAWIERMTAPITDLGDGSAYGLMWWVNPARGAFRPEGGLGPLATEPHFAAQGAAAHKLLVVPGRRLLIVHRSDNDSGRGMLDERIPFGLADRILAAKRSPTIVASAPLAPLAPTPFATARPAPPERIALALDPLWTERTAGRYVMPDGTPFEVEVDDGRLFAWMLGKGQTELLAESSTRFFSRSAPVAVECVVAADASACDEIVVELMGRRMTARRVAPAAD